jgi:hypothetical protein
MSAGVGITVTGVTVASGATSASVAMPTLPGGVLPKWVRIAASNAAYVKLGASGVTAAAGDAIVQPGDALVLRAHGHTFIAALQQSAAGIVQISPLDDA